MTLYIVATTKYYAIYGRYRLTNTNFYDLILIEKPQSRQRLGFPVKSSPLGG